MPEIPDKPQKSDRATAAGAAETNPPGFLDKLFARLSIARDRLVDRNLRNRLISTNLKSTHTKNIRFANANSQAIFEITP